MRLQSAFRPGTRINQKSQITTYLRFCITNHLRHVNPSCDTLCMYTEFLTQKLKSPKSVRNYLSSVTLFHKYRNASFVHANDFEFRLMLRSLPLTKRHFPNQVEPVTPKLLLEICKVCEELGSMGIVLKFAYTLAFFSFVRQSNLAPVSAKLFDETRHTTRGDVTFESPGLVLSLKWTKTHQNPSFPSRIPIPRVTHPTVDPVRAYQRFLRLVPSQSANGPLLIWMGGSTVTASQLQRCLRSIVKQLGYPSDRFSMHSMRRGGASTCAQASIDYMHIQRHGTWSSECFWNYISANMVNTSPVPEALAKAFSN